MLNLIRRWCFVCILFAISIVEACNRKHPDNVNESNMFFEKFIRLYTLQSETIQNQLCRNHSHLLYTGVKEFQPWALRMIDASEKLQPGILSGNFFGMGHLGECLSVNKQTSFGNIMGKECLLNLEFNDDFIKKLSAALVHPLERTILVSARWTVGLSWAVCVPQSCPVEDVVSHYQVMLPALLGGLPVNVSGSDAVCAIADSNNQFSIYAKIVLFVIFLLVLITILSTIYEYWWSLNGKKSSKQSILFAFSLITNTKKLCSLNPPGYLECLNGIRVLSCFWVVTLHRSHFINALPSTNMENHQQWLDNYFSMFLQAGSVAVDSFFVISGVLVVVSFFRQNEIGVPFNIFKYYLHRYVRTTALTLLMMLIYGGLTNHLGSGLLWESYAINLLQKPCQKYWWSTLLYIQNYVNPHAVCLLSTWSTSADMQLFWFSPLILFPLKSHPKVGLTLLLIVTCISFGWTAQHAWIKHYKGEFFLIKTFLSTEYLQKFYFGTQYRAKTYFIGMILGYVLLKTRNINFKINKVLVAVLWAISTAVIFYVILGLYPLIQYKNPYMPFQALIYLSLNRVLWSLALSWIIFASVKGYGGIINTFLSLPMFQVLARLTYGIVMIHLLMQASMMMAVKSSKNFSIFELIHGFMGDFVFSAIFAIPLSLLIEYPVFAIEDFCFRKVE